MWCLGLIETDDLTGFNVGNAWESAVFFVAHASIVKVILIELKKYSEMTGDRIVYGEKLAQQTFDRLKFVIE